MHKRILFVDDEPMVLDGLRRMLRSMREEWDMEFVGGGKEALERMSPNPFDVIVADMRMPGMNGAELLNEVMKRYPRTVRLILSGHADKDLILQCVGSTHQYLAKPCSADELKATVTRASRLDSELESENLKKLVGQLRCLPSIPDLYVEIVEAVNKPDATLEEVGAIVSRDLGMTTSILKLVNSAYFGLRRELASAQEAVAYIGLDTIKALVLSIHAFDQFKEGESGGVAVGPLWNHSLKVAGFAKSIACLEGADRKGADESYTAGLLHDVGKLVLAANLPRDYEQCLELSKAGSMDLFEAEVRIFGADHATLGGYLLGLWGLPVPVVEAIALHHSPGRAASAGISPLTIVHCANVFAHVSSDPIPHAMGSKLDTSYLDSIGISSRMPAWLECLPGK